MKKYIAISLLLTVFIYFSMSCKPGNNNNVVSPDGNFPPEIASIMIKKCATVGCHNTANQGNAYLALDSWEHLFEGDIQGSVVIPYCTKYSYLLYTVNVDPTLGTIVPPAMPFSADGKTPPLSKTEYLTLSNWIAKGAPDKYGNIPFASNPDTRQKIYLTEQGCDLVSVIDAKSMLIMRYIQVGMDSTRTESPHSITVSSDGMSAYVCFFASDYIQKIDTRTDTVIASTNIGSFLPGGSGGSWGIIIGSPAADTAVAVTNWQQYPSGAFDIMKANPFQNEFHYTNNNALSYAHGIASNYNFDTFYISSNYGNCITKFSRKALDTFPPQSPIKQISLDNNPIVTTGGPTTPDPHEIVMSFDYSKYFVTCQNTNEVRVMDAHADTLIAVIPVGKYPQELTFSTNPLTPYLFTACMLDPSTYPGAEGSIYVINYNTYQVVAKIYGDFARPHDISVDDADGLLFIPSSNTNPNGPPAHHATACGGRAGWYSVYKFGPGTFTPVNTRRYQTTVQPYSIGARFGG